MLVLLAGTAASATCRDRDPLAPRVLILSLDGLSYQAMERARGDGAFDGWPETKALVSTFPSMTNVAFAAIYRPFGMEPIKGYELRYFDIEENRITGGGPVGYKKKAYHWKDYYQVISHTNMEKAGAYTSPRKNVRSVMGRTEQLVLEGSDEFVIAHIGSTDVVSHFRGPDPVVEILVEISMWLDGLIEQHATQRHRELQVVLLSDHGNSEEKIQNTSGIRSKLREAGLNVVSRLEGPNDVVAPTYGVVNYGVLFTNPAKAEVAARAVVEHEAVDLGAWIEDQQLVRVISKEGHARVRWEERGGRRYFGYESDGTDPLRLNDILAEMVEQGLVDGDGFAVADDWFRFSASGAYPDPLRRLVDSLTGAYVSNPATVVFSLMPGYAWGTKSARLLAQLLGGDLEGTHGGLDRSSTLGVFLTNSAGLVSDRTAIAADAALVPWSDLFRCIGEPLIASTTSE